MELIFNVLTYNLYLLIEMVLLVVLYIFHPYCRSSMCIVCDKLDLDIMLAKLFFHYKFVRYKSHTVILVASVQHGYFIC